MRSSSSPLDEWLAAFLCSIIYYILAELPFSTDYILNPQPAEIIVEPFDGQNWEQHAAKLARFSKELD